MPMPVRSASDVIADVERLRADLGRPDVHKDQAWLETMLAYAVNLLSQAWDQLPAGAVGPTTGTASDPDMYDIGSFMAEVRKYYPRF